jgi:hypothetical protein
VTRRIVVVPLYVPTWSPPGVALEVFRRVLADDAVDMLATLAEVEPALAVREDELHLAAAVGWPSMRVYGLGRLCVPAILEVAAADGFEQAAVIAPDAPDLPGMLIAKLLRPLSTRPVAAAPAAGDAAGLVGFACRLPAPEWLPEIDLDTATVAGIRAAAPSHVDIVGTPGWHRLRTPEAFGRLDPALDGWDATRALLRTGRARSGL